MLFVNQHKLMEIPTTEWVVGAKVNKEMVVEVQVKDGITVVDKYEVDVVPGDRQKSGFRTLMDEVLL